MKKYFIILGCIQIFIALGAIPAGYGYISDTSGVNMGTSIELLKNSPLTSFLIPGLFLMIVHGLGNLAGAILSFRKNTFAGKTALVLGIILCIWIIIQVYWIGLSSFMQPLFLFIGMIEASLGFFILKGNNDGKS
ncbi:MAG: hypothetical protein A2066_03520 [Bacteroidetes bacterium GWB2_41_8]|nr:MAG: hypothetical protein A2066_03520 [Bacteroidetes bacterium GWB2_41_8]